MKNFNLTIILILLAVIFLPFVSVDAMEDGAQMNRELSTQTLKDVLTELDQVEKKPKLVIFNSQSKEDQINDLYRIIEKKTEAIGQLNDHDTEILMNNLAERESTILDNELPRKGDEPVTNENDEHQINTFASLGSWKQRRGNFLVSMTQKTAGFPHGHTGILTGSSNQIIEATTTTHYGAKVFRWDVDRMWQAPGDVKEYYVNGATWAQYDKAVSFSRQQVNKPYSLKKFLYDKSGYYCSKLIFLAYLEAGISLANSITQLFITPGNLALHYHTRLYRNIGGGSLAY